MIVDARVARAVGFEYSALKLQQSNALDVATARTRHAGKRSRRPNATIRVPNQKIHPRHRRPPPRTIDARARHHRALFSASDARAGDRARRSRRRSIVGRRVVDGVRSFVDRRSVGVGRHRLYTAYTHLRIRPYCRCIQTHRAICRRHAHPTRTSHESRRVSTTHPRVTGAVSSVPSHRCQRVMYV